MEITATTSRNKETSHRWVVLLSSTFVTLISFGLMLTFGSVFLSLLDKFGETRAASAVVQLLLMASGSGYGMGISNVHISEIVAVGRFFHGRHQTFAVSIQSVGTPLAGFVFPPLITLLNKTYSLRGMYLILGGILLNNLAGAIVFAYVTVPSGSDSKWESDTVNNDDIRSGKVTELQDIGEAYRNAAHLDLAAHDRFNRTYMEQEPKPEHLKRVNSLVPVKVEECTYSSENGSTILQTTFEDMHKQALSEEEVNVYEKRVGLVSFSFVHSRPGQSRSKVTTAAQDRRLSLMAMRRRFGSEVTFNRDFKSRMDTGIPFRLSGTDSMFQACVQEDPF